MHAEIGPANDNQFIVLSGLPGAGKSSIAEALGRRLDIPVFAKDWLEATLCRCGLGLESAGQQSAGYAGYELLTTLAARQLHLGQSLILDSVASFARIRAQWRALARQHGADWRVIECVCSDECLHRQRLNGRVRGIPGWRELEWAEVERVRGYYEPWQEARLVLDAVHPLAENVAAALAYLDGKNERL